MNAFSALHLTQIGSLRGRVRSYFVFFGLRGAAIVISKHVFRFDASIFYYIRIFALWTLWLGMTPISVRIIGRSERVVTV